MEKVEEIIQELLKHKYFKFFIGFLALLGSLMFIRSSEMGAYFGSDSYMALSQRGLELSELFQANTFPVAKLISYFESLFFGENLQMYRAFHLLVHIITTFSLSMILKKLNFKYFWIVGLIFLVHPAHMYSLNVFESMNSIYSVLFMCLSIFLYLRQLKVSKTYNPYLIGSLFFYFISIQCHYLALFLPLVFFLFGYKKGDSESLKYHSRLLAFFIFMFMKVINIVRIAPIEFAQNETHPYLLNAFELGLMRFSHSYEVLIAPNTLSPLYSFASYNGFTGLHAGLFILLIITHMLLLRGSHLSHVAKVIPFVFLPLSGLFAFRYYEIAPYSEDLFYLLYFVVWTFIIGIIDKVFSPRDYVISIIGIFLTLFFIFYNIGFYKKYENAEAFYRYIIERSPDKYHGYVLLAEYLEKQDNLEEAQAQLLESEPYWLYFPDSAVNKIKSKITVLEFAIREKEKKKGESPRP
jgi:hypothetical protein